MYYKRMHIYVHDTDTYVYAHKQLYQESLVVLIKVLGGSHVLVANTKNNIAGIYLKQGKCEEALQCYMEALDVKLKVRMHVYMCMYMYSQA